MIERYRAALAEKADQAKATRTKSNTPQYIFLPNALLEHPPIRHRDQEPDSGFSVYEFAIAAACAFLARQNLASVRHVHSLRKGNEAIRRQRQNAANWHHISNSPTDFIKETGSFAYADASRAFDTAPSEKTLRLDVTKTKLLRIASVSRKGDNWGRLEDALRRLTEPAGSFAPSLRGWERLPNGKLRLNVHPNWVPQGQYTRVLWPLPTSGPTILALYLFLSFIAGFERRRSTNISTEALYRRVGIPLSRPAHAERSLNRALVLVNAHYRRHSAAVAELEMPRGWKLAPVGDGTSVHFAYLGVVEAAKDQNEGLEDDDVFEQDSERSDELTRRWKAAE
jgi:hypothetical protein